MRQRYLVIGVLLLLLSAAGTGAADSELMKEFETKYARLDIDLLNNPCEIGDVTDFVYTKDVATFTFTEGKMFLLRYVDDRPTTALFVGNGSASIPPPEPPVERYNLAWASGDTLVNEEFEICYMHIGDDFDLAVKENTSFELSTLEFKYYTQAMQAQGEFYFRPRIFHTFDNYFQLVRSCYERGPDGFFWADFNRYNFMYDPNRPEETIISFEKFGGDFAITDGAVLQKQERDITTSFETSDIPYPTTLLDIKATVEMGGMDARRMDGCEATVRVRVNKDSLRFVGLFLNYNLKEDSIYYNGEPVDYKRRKDFSYIGTVLPEYVYRGDTLTFTLWYRGTDFVHAFPFVEDPTPCPHTLHFRVPRDYQYLMPGKGPVGRDGKVDTFTVRTTNPYWRFSFQGYVSGYDTVPLPTDMGITINRLKTDAIKKDQQCYIPDSPYEAALVQSFDFATGILGPPPGVFSLTVFPDSNLAMPGLVNVPQIYCYTGGTGGIGMKAAQQMSRQWYGATLKPASEREYWLADAVPDYFGLMFAREGVSPDAFYSELEDRRRQILTFRDRDGDQPLAVGNRANAALRAYKGSWLMHMLRFVMLDLATASEQRFNRFLAELASLANSAQFTNADVVALAEKHYGDSLGWFFDHWLFGRGIPKYDIAYSIEERDDGYWVAGTATTSEVPSTYRMPVVMRVELVDGNSEFFQPMLAAPEAGFEFGPFEGEPRELFFNEFYSVLCNYSVNKR
ncbi:hypothetical protein GF420_10325 [candidate division GN15 bacterium]|nr:hypothetical protein [candidate division GN15 bacterium]